MFGDKKDNSNPDKPPLDLEGIGPEATWILGELMAECMPFRNEEEEDAICEKAARMALKLRRSLARLIVEDEKFQELL